MTNKLPLAAIAFGLWVNAAILLVRPVQAQSDQLAGGVQQIAEELHQPLAFTNVALDLGEVVEKQRPLHAP